MSDLSAGSVAYPGAGAAGARVVAGGWGLDDTALPPDVPAAPPGPDPGAGMAAPEGE